MIVKVPKFGWGGLNTRADETGLPLLECVTLNDLRVVGMDLVQRKGIVRVAQLGGNAKALDFTSASSDMLSNLIDARVWGLGLKWTVEVLIEPDSTGGTDGIFCAGHTTPAMILDRTGGNVRFRVWDSGGTLSTATVGAEAATLQSVQITRDGTAITTRLNNVAGGTTTMSATLDVRTPVGDLRIARDNGGNYLDGTVDYLRVLSIVKDDHADRLVRLPNPRASYVLADYDMNMTGTLVYDRSRYENHLIATNIATGDEVTSLCHNPAPVRAISMGVDKDNKRQVLIAAGGLYYIGEVS